MSLSALHSLVSGIDRITEWVGRAIAWLTLVMVIVTTCIVLLRYGLDLGWIAMQESVLYLHALVFLLGASYALKHDAHVRVDVFYRQFSARKKAWVNLLGGVCFLIPVSLYIVISSWGFIHSSWAVFESSAEAGGLPLVFLLKSFILLFVVNLLLQGIAEIGRSILVLKQGATK